MSSIDFDKLFSSFSNVKVAVIGDVMLDTYMWGKVERISPEAPVPVVSLRKKEFRIGGAGNVALNLRSLDAKVSVLSVIGEDDDGKKLKQLFDDNKINTEFLLASPNRVTTNKIRVISRNQQMMRLDNEVTHDLEYEDENRLVLAMQQFIAQEKPQVMIFEDYDKGVLTKPVIQKTIALCKHHGIITTVDPKRRNFFSYTGVDIFKPNLKEVKEGLNIIEDNLTVEFLQQLHRLLKEKLQHHISFITLSESGVYYEMDGHHHLIPSHLRNISDVSGAGDTVIAVASLVYAATKNVGLMAEMANIAGGIVCEEVGTVAIDKHKLLKECRTLIA
ncbi:MAG TPA: bifunctional ADP-heptose synthase [Chitinophagaceae bacterium]|nr:bifunctional ADP-heptose synthase [Chitinophagaceae bacterium]